MNHTKSLACLLTILLLCLLLCGCEPVAKQTEVSSDPVVTTVIKEPVQDINAIPLEDDSSLYEAYDPLSVVCFYITVRSGSAADGTNHTFQEVNAYKNLQGMTNVQKIYADALFQVGDENGPLKGEVGYGLVQSNATINVRGRTSTGYAQKSYRISLRDNAGFWRGQRAIALNKHPGDPTRLRNMLYFTLLRDVPGLTSLQTQFVHVYIKDETDPQAANAFVDHGLYTQVELPNNRYLYNHGLSRDGDLYKANLCELFRYPDQLKLATDSTYDEAAFSSVLEPKTGNDHSKLLAMLDAVNDYTIPIEQTVEKYFNLENLTSYVAFNLLMANPDSDAQNYFLYSPVNSNTWYYLCWDGDGALGYYEDELIGNAWKEGSWTHGISNYWSVVLFNRMFRVPAYRDALTEKVKALHQIITPERMAALIAQYRTVVDQYTTSMPDALHMEMPTAKLELLYQNMPYDTNTAYEEYIASLEKPMPFYLSNAEASGGQLTLQWDPAYDFDGEFVRYDVAISSDWTFAESAIVSQCKGQLETSVVFPLPAAGEYYWRVIATNESGETQISFDQVETASGLHEGMRWFSVSPDGTVSN